MAPPSGTAIRVQLNQVAEDCDPSVLADTMAAAACAQLKPLAVRIDDVRASTIALPGGRVCHQRRFDFERDGLASMARIVCFVDGGLAFTLASSWVAGEDRVDREVDAALASIRLLSRPVATFASAVDPQAKVPTVKRPPVDGSAWSELRIARLDSDMRSVDVDEITRWSPAELAVCATILGAATFPTVGPELLASLPAAELSATLDTVTRSFMARGVIQPGEDGWTTLSDGLREIMEVAVFPDLAISVERVDATGTRLWWLGLRPDCGVQVAVRPDGSRECAAIDPSCVVRQIFAVTGTGVPATDGAPAGPDPDSVSLTDLASGASRVAAVVRVNTAWRVGELIRGGVFAWAVGVDGSHWLAEPRDMESSPGWTLAPVDVEGVRAELLDHLPGTPESSPS